jgi:hypothetical protein
VIGVHVSDWHSASINVEGEQLFVIGDIHGCAAQLVAWLDACESLRGGVVGKRV